MFDNATSLQLSSPVRIAGVEVGKVTKVEAGRRRLHGHGRDDEAQRRGAADPQRRRAEDPAADLPRGQLLRRPQAGHPGGARARLRRARSRRPRPARRCSSTRCWARCKTDARKDLQKLIQGYGDAIGGEPEPGRGRRPGPRHPRRDRGRVAERLARGLAEALRGHRAWSTRRCSAPSRATSPAGQGRPEGHGRARAAARTSCKDLITNFNITTGALAAEQGDLRRTDARCCPRCSTRPTRRSTAQRRLPAAAGVRARDPARASARPPPRSTPRFPWIAQTRRLVSPAELQGLVSDLRPAVRDLAAVTDGTVRAAAAGRPRQPLPDRQPAADRRRGDPGRHLTTGVENYKEFFQTLVGLSGESQNFDGNGQLHALPDRRRRPTRVDRALLGHVGPLFGNALRQPLGTRPARPGKQPPVQPHATPATRRSGPT